MIKHAFFSLLLLLGVNAARAESPAWTLVPDESSIQFAAVNNNVPVKGAFEKFAADIHFDPAKPETSTVKATIDIKSVTSDYEEVAEQLRSASWFDAEKYPEVIFESQSFKHLGGDKYEAKGMLKIREANEPVTLPFTLAVTTEGKTQKAVMDGTLSINRTKYGVGTGEWQATTVVADKVDITIHLTATRALP